MCIPHFSSLCLIIADFLVPSVFFSTLLSSSMPRFFSCGGSCAFHQSSEAFVRDRGEFILETRRLFPIWVSAPSVSLPHCLRHESRDTVQVRPTWQEGELQRKAEFISCSCESYISTIPLCAVWQQRNDGCHLSCGLKEAVGKGI